MTYPPSPYFSDLALMQSRGEALKAQVLLDALNRVNAAFGKPLYAMPPAMKPLRDGLYIARADQVSPTQFLTALGRETILDLEARRNDDGSYSVAA